MEAVEQILSLWRGSGLSLEEAVGAVTNGDPAALDRIMPDLLASGDPWRKLVVDAIKAAQRAAKDSEERQNLSKLAATMRKIALVQ
jgi:hypothetical protein